MFRDKLLISTIPEVFQLLAGVEAMFGVIVTGGDEWLVPEDVDERQKLDRQTF